MKYGVVSLIFVILAKDLVVSAAKLNHPRVLLPIFNEKAINFTLEVDEANCYKWTASREDLISVTPVFRGFSECAYHAVVTVRTHDRRRNTAIVFAEDVTTGETLRSDVILDVIASLNVRTATRKLYLEEAPAMFELHAFDEEGNEFFTLEGIEFVWDISELGGSNKPPAMRYLTFTDSPYHTVPLALETFEAEGTKGHMILLEGINTGTSKVTIKMPQPEYVLVSPIEVYISVLANIIIEPSEVTILSGDTITFRILQLKMDGLHEITDNKQYYLEVEDLSVAYLHGSSATGGRLGRTQVILKDRNMVDNNKAGDAKGPSALLTVAEPLKLGISLLPHLNWITVQGHQHTVAMDLFTADGQKITLGNRYTIASELDESIFAVNLRTQNGSHLFGEAIQEGITQVYGSYKDLSVQAELQIFEDLKLTPLKVLIPYDPSSTKPLKVQFYASGGDNNYAWFSGNSQVLQIDSQGLATAEIRDVHSSIASQEAFEQRNSLITHTTVKVALAKNYKISRLAYIYFLTPKRLEIKQYNFETAVEDYVHLHLAVYAWDGNSEHPFTSCENLNFQLTFSHSILQQESTGNGEKIVPGACHVLRLRAIADGSTSLRISYVFKDQELYDTVELHVFEPLSVLNPVENEIVLPVGSSRNLMYKNGPQHIFTLEAKLTKTTVFDNQVIKVSELNDTQTSIAAFTVLCHSLGETELTYHVHNILIKPNITAYKSEITTKVYCVRPRFLQLFARQQLRESCPLEHSLSLLFLKDKENKFEIEISIQDARNRRLMNISSLWLDWEFAAGDKRYNKDGLMHTQISELNSIYGVMIPSRDILVLTLPDVSPNFSVKGTVARYNDKLLAHLNVVAEKPPFRVKDPKNGLISTPLIENEVRFQTVNRSPMSKEFIHIFLATNHSKRISLSQGSGYFELALSEQGIVSANYNTKARVLVLTPIHLGHVDLELTDLCLTNDPSRLSISVVGIGAIKISCMDRVERSSRIEAIVRLFDTNGNLLEIDHKKLNMYNVSELVFDPTILSIRLGEQDNLGTGEIRYFISGNNLGETKIIFQSGKDDHVVLSEPLNIHVFTPIRLHPRNITMVVGSSFQISYHGGPKTNTNVMYTVERDNIASKYTVSIKSIEYIPASFSDINSATVTAYKLGDTHITGMCIIKNPVTNRDEVISQDTVWLHVVSLKAVKIHVPLLHIQIGAVMPATIWGQPFLSPIVLGTLQNMKVSWTVNQPDVMEIYNIFTEAGIDYQEEDLISVRFRAINSGKVTITASVMLEGGYKLPPARVEISVFKRLELVSPKPIKMDSILVPPSSMIQLNSNIDNVVYKLASKKSGYFSISPNGILQTKEILGRDQIIAETLDQTLSIDIEVKNVEYILVTLLPTVKLKRIEHKIPRGMNFVFKVSMHDNLGNEFAETIGYANGLHYEMATMDTVDTKIDNNLTFALNLHRDTKNVIAIGLKDPTGVKPAYDYIKISVVESDDIYPTKTIFSVGDIICFNSPLTSSIWRSSNEKIVPINKQTGVARVMHYRPKMGEKIIITNGDTGNRGGFIKYDLEIRDFDVILFTKSLDIFSGTEYRAKLVLRNHVQTDKYNNMVALNISKCAAHLKSEPVDFYSCRLIAKNDLSRQLLKLYKVEALFDAGSGQYNCRLELLSNFFDLLAIVKSNDVDLDLEAASSNGISDTMSLKLVPGVKVTPESIHVRDIKSQELHISGLNKALHKVQVTPSDSKFIAVDLIEYGHGVSKYLLRFLDGLPLDEQLYVQIISPDTEQSIKVPILINTALAPKCGGRPLLYQLLENLGFILTTTVIVIISIWVYMSCFQTQSVTQVNSEGKFGVHLDGNSSITPIIFLFVVIADTSNPQNNSQGRIQQYNLSNESFVYGHPRLNSPNRSNNSSRFN
ncbi:hypothetical protein KR018_010193 [Drosophila ironensis]|nr:hypothetical protein KR018_010193 [Drosophila ironensis]